MIVCSCNVISDRAIRATLGDGGACGGRVSDVFDCLGCRPQCGRCALSIRRVIREATAEGATTCPAALDDTSSDPAIRSFALAAE